MNLFELFAKISLDTSSYEQGIKKAKESMDDLGNSSGKVKPNIQSLGGALTELYREATKLTVLKSIANFFIDFAKAGIRYNMTIETYTTNFSVLLGSEEKAIAKLQELKELDARSPFDLTSLLDATQSLIAYGVAAEDTGEVLQRLGDISLGSTEKLNGLSYAYAQMAAAGKANMQDIRQMINAGFNPLNAIAELTGETMAELQERVSAGAVAFSEIEMAVKYATSAVGTFTEADKEAAREFAKRQELEAEAKQAQIDAIEEAHEAEIEALEDALEAREDTYKKQEDALKKSQETELAIIKAASEEKIALIDKEYEANLKLINEEEYRRIAAIDAEIDALEKESEEEDKLAKERERAETIADYERRIQNSSSIRFREALEDELAEYKEQIRREDAEAERQAQIDSLEREKETIKSQTKTRKEALKEQYDEEKRMAKETAQAVYDEFEAKFADELAYLKQKNADELKDYEAFIDKEKAYAKEQHEAAVKDIETTHSDVTSSIEEVEGKFSGAMETNTQTLEGQLSNLETRWGSFSGEVMEPFNDELTESILPNLSKMLDSIEKLVGPLSTVMGLVADIVGGATEVLAGIIGFFDMAFTGEGFDDWWYAFKHQMGIDINAPNPNDYALGMHLEDDYVREDASSTSSSSSSQTNTSININITNPNATAEEIAQAVQEALDEREAANG